MSTIAAAAAAALSCLRFYERRNGVTLLKL